MKLVGTLWASSKTISLINQHKINIIATREKTTIPGAVSFFFNPFDSLCLSKREVQPNNVEEFRKKRSNSFLSRGRRIDANVPDVLGNYCLLIEWEFKQLGQSRHGCCKKHRTRNDPDNPKSVQCKEIENPQEEENYLSRLLAGPRDRCIERRTATQARWRRRR